MGAGDLTLVLTLDCFDVRYGVFVHMLIHTQNLVKRTEIDRGDLRQEHREEEEEEEAGRWKTDGHVQ